LYYRDFFAGSVSNNAVRMTLLVPGMLPISVPAAYAFGLVYAVPGRLWSRRLAALALGVAILCGTALFANMAWVAPESNQRFRETVMQRPIPRGENELSFEGLRQRRAEYQHLGQAADVRRADFSYHQRLTMAAASVVLAGFAMAVGVRSRRPAWQLALAVLAACVVYEELHVAGAMVVKASVLPPLAAAWLPNAVLLASSALVAARRSST
jgi:lipopolysaccharide export LptBFGC system permease protein LptF